MITVQFLMAMTFVVSVICGFLAHAFRRAVIDSPRVQSWLRRGFAAAFAGLGVNSRCPPGRAVAASRRGIHSYEEDQHGG